LALTRRKVSSDEVFKNALQRVGALDTRLNEVGEKLSADLAQAKSWLDSKSMSDDDFSRFCVYVTEFAARLPQTCGPRFLFDTAFIRSLARDFASELPPSGMILPWYEREWGYERLEMAWEGDASHAHVIHLIHFPGQDRTEDINLLAYPWMAHEWGHYIMFRHDLSFSQDFQSRFGEITNSLRRSAIPYRGFLRAKSQEHIQELVRFWTPTADHRNWAHELALDLLSLWTCGPAYLACFKDYLAHRRPDPYMIEPTHPPYSVRAEALVKAARQLGLEAYTTGLARVVASWDESNWTTKKDNHFIGLNNQQIVDACIEAAFTFCGFLKLAKCSADRVERIRTNRGKSEVRELGLDLLLKARAVFVDDGEKTYDQWEEMTIDQLAKDVRP
jgi:hypothetical protein